MTTPDLPPLEPGRIYDERNERTLYPRKQVLDYALAAYAAGRDAGIEECYRAADTVLPFRDEGLRSPVAVRSEILNAINALKLGAKEPV